MSAAAAAAPRQLTLFCHPEARSLVEGWSGHISVVESSQPPRNEAGFFLWAVADHVSLCRGRERGVWVTRSELERRAVQGGDLARACGVAEGRGLRVLDAMGGWGVDGLVLARRGCDVTLVERQPALWVLQQDLLRRSGLTAVTAHCDDAFSVLERSMDWDVVYLDPMFPGRAKSALPGKRMQWLAQLAVADPRPLAQWLRVAVAAARQRVVLKRRRKDPEIQVPDWRILGRTVRYDIYRGGASAPR